MAEMSEITTAKYNEWAVDQMVEAYTNDRLNGEMNLWELRQTWKAARIDKVRRHTMGGIVNDKTKC